MNVLFDTNVIVDALAERNNEYKYSQMLIQNVVVGNIKGYISSKQVTDIYYILRKYYNDNVRRQIIKTISETFSVLPLISGYITYCVNSKMNDYEDAILDETAKVNMIPFIVTNNIKDFANSNTTPITPKDLYKLIEATEIDS